jgi:hypothetical protein
MCQKLRETAAAITLGCSKSTANKQPIAAQVYCRSLFSTLDMSFWGCCGGDEEGSKNGIFTVRKDSPTVTIM